MGLSIAPIEYRLLFAIVPTKSLVTNGTTSSGSVRISAGCRYGADISLCSAHAGTTEGHHCCYGNQCVALILRVCLLHDSFMPNVTMQWTSIRASREDFYRLVPYERCVQWQPNHVPGTRYLVYASVNRRASLVQLQHNNVP